MLSTREIKEIIKRELEPFFIENGFKSKNENELVFSYSRESEGISFSLKGNLLKYNEHILVYHFYFGNYKVIEVLKEIDQHVPLSKNKYVIADSLITISPGVILFPKETDRPYKSFNDEFGLKLILFDIQSFYQGFYLSFCKKYSDIKQLDKLFNRLDDFRTDSSVFPGLTFFYVSRLIIAKLANNSNFDEIVERNFQSLEELWKKEGAVYNKHDQSKPEVFAARYLKEKSFEERIVAS